MNMLTVRHGKRNVLLFAGRQCGASIQRMSRWILMDEDGEVKESNVQLLDDDVAVKHQ